MITPDDLKGEIHFIGTRQDGSKFDCYIKFDGLPSIKDTIDTAQRFGLVIGQAVGVQQVINPLELQSTTKWCPDHGMAKLKPNNGKGSHTWFCAGKKPDGSWCSKKFTQDGEEVRK